MHGANPCPVDTKRGRKKMGEEKQKPVRYGTWIRLGHDNLYRCSACGDCWIGIDGFNYCPHCGAKMWHVRDADDAD